MMAGKQKPAIFVFTTAYLPFIGGAEISIQETASRLSEDFDFYVFTSRFRRDLPPREKKAGTTVIRLGLGSPLDKWLMAPLAVPAVFREMRRLKIRRPVLWGVDVSAGALTAAFLRLLKPKLPFVFTIQYGYGEERLARGRLGAIGVAFRFILRRACAVTAISDHLADTARRFGWHGPIAVIPNGVDINKFASAAKEPSAGGGKVIIHVGRLVPKNGTDILIRAVRELRNYATTQLNIKLIIVGGGPERSMLEKLTCSLGLDKAVEFLGEVPYEEVPRYLAKADIFVRPSRSEGLGNAFLEALSAGLPIIGTPVGGIPDIIQDGKTGLFCRVDDPADLAEKIKRLLRDRGLRESIVSNGRAMIRERFSWEAISAAYANIFRRVSAGLRILIATPQFPPDIGGPGSHAHNLAEHLSAEGCRVSILTYGPKRNTAGLDIANVSHGWPSGLKHFVYFWKAFRLLGQCDVALALDPVIVGFPVALACAIRQRPIIMRVEGDFLWEWHVERTGEELTLRNFCERFSSRRLSAKERLMHSLARFVFLRAAKIVFSSKWRKDIFAISHTLRPEQARIIFPPWPAPESGVLGREKTFLYAGRFVKVKNLERLIRAFASSAPPEFRLELIGDGPEKKNLEFIIQNLKLGGRVVIRPPLSPKALAERIASVHAFLLPSLSDVSPNVILDCLRTGTPFLLTKETGFFESLKEVGLFVDPLDESDIKAKLRQLCDPVYYRAYQERLVGFKVSRSWDEVADDWRQVIQEVL